MKNWGGEGNRHWSTTTLDVRGEAQRGRRNNNDNATRPAESPCDKLPSTIKPTCIIITIIIALPYARFPS